VHRRLSRGGDTVPVGGTTSIRGRTLPSRGTISSNRTRRGVALSYPVADQIPSNRRTAISVGGVLPGRTPGSAGPGSGRGRAAEAPLCHRCRSGALQARGASGRGFGRVLDVHRPHVAHALHVVRAHVPPEPAEPPRLFRVLMTRVGRRLFTDLLREAFFEPIVSEMLGLAETRFPISRTRVSAGGENTAHGGVGKTTRLA